MNLTEEEIQDLERKAFAKMVQDASAKLAAPGEIVTHAPEKKPGSVGSLLGGVPKNFAKAGVVAYNRAGKTQVDPRIYKIIRDSTMYGTWVAEKWLGFVWHSDDRWFCEVWSKKILIGTYNESDFKQLISICRERHGKE